MNQSRREMFNLTVSEWEGFFPENGSKTYILQSKYYANAKNKIRYDSVKEINISVLDSEHNFGKKHVNFTTKRSQHKVNGKVSSTSNLLGKVASVYDDLDLKLSHKGELSKVKNFPSIQYKWKIVKKTILNSCSGQTLRIFIRDMDKNMSSEQIFIQYINQDRQLGLFLKGIFGKYDTITPIVVPKKVMTSRKLVSINEVIKMNRLADNDKEVRFKLNKDETIEEAVFNYHGSYEIDISTNWINSAILQYEEKDSTKKIKHQFLLDKK